MRTGTRASSYYCRGRPGSPTAAVGSPGPRSPDPPRSTTVPAMSAGARTFSTTGLPAHRRSGGRPTSMAGRPKRAAVFFEVTHRISCIVPRFVRGCYFFFSFFVVRFFFFFTRARVGASCPSTEDTSIASSCPDENADDIEKSYDRSARPRPDIHDSRCGSMGVKGAVALPKQK